MKLKCDTYVYSFCITVISLNQIVSIANTKGTGFKSYTREKFCLWNSHLLRHCMSYVLSVLSPQTTQWSRVPTDGANIRCTVCLESLRKVLGRTKFRITRQKQNGRDSSTSWRANCKSFCDLWPYQRVCGFRCSLERAASRYKCLDRHLQYNTQVDRWLYPTLLDAVK